MKLFEVNALDYDAYDVRYLTVGTETDTTDTIKQREWEKHVKR